MIPALLVTIAKSEPGRTETEWQTDHQERRSGRRFSGVLQAVTTNVFLWPCPSSCGRCSVTLLLCIQRLPGAAVPFLEAIGRGILAAVFSGIHVVFMFSAIEIRAFSTGMAAQSQKIAEWLALEASATDESSLHPNVVTRFPLPRQLATAAAQDNAIRHLVRVFCWLFIWR